jgi:hypothetical protein
MLEYASRFTIRRVSWTSGAPETLAPVQLLDYEENFQGVKAVESVKFFPPEILEHAPCSSVS